MAGQRLWKCRQQARRRLHENHPRCCRIEATKFLVHAKPSEFGDRACKLYTRRAAADDEEGQQRLTLLQVVSGFRTFKCREYAATNLRRIFYALQAGREGRPLILAEIAVRRAGGQNQIVIWDLLVAHHDSPACSVNGGNRTEQHPDVERVAKQRAHGRGDIARRKRRGRHLIEKRLKQVVISAIDDRDRRTHTAQRRGTGDAAKSRTDDHYAWQAIECELRTAVEFRNTPPQLSFDPGIHGGGARTVNQQHQQYCKKISLIDPRRAHHGVKRKQQQQNPRQITCGQSGE